MDNTNTTPNTADTTTTAGQQANTQPTAENTQPTQPTQPTEPAEPVYTVDSYKDLGFDGYKDLMDVDDKGVQDFKQFGVDNKISPASLQAFVNWSAKVMKENQEAYKRTQESWKQENAAKYGDNLKNVQTNVGRVLAEYDKSGNFANLLQSAGAQEHPATLEFLNALADVLLEKGSVNPNASPEGKEVTLEDMYKTQQ